MTKNASCPTCRGVTNLRACPECHTALPVHFDESEIVTFGLVGAKGSGKTVLMTVLVKELRDAIGNRYHADISLATDNPDGLAGEADYEANREDALYEKRELPTSTQVAGSAARPHSASVMLRWRQEGRRLFGLSATKSTIMAFVDSAGEQGNSLTDAFTLEYLEACNGLIVLLDPFALAGARAMLNLPPEAISVEDRRPLNVVKNITEKLRIELALRMNQKIPIPAAVVFTKMDAFFPVLDRYDPLMTKAPQENAYGEDDGRLVHEHMRSLLYRWGAQDIDAHISGNYRDYSYFGVSALGAEPDYLDHKVAPGGVRPHRVEDPLLWLLAKRGTVRTVTAGTGNGSAGAGQTTRPPPVPPREKRTGSRRVLLIVAAAVVVVGAGAGALLGVHPWIHPPVLRPTGILVVNSGTSGQGAGSAVRDP